MSFSRRNISNHIVNISVQISLYDRKIPGNNIRKLYLQGSNTMISNWKTLSLQNPTLVFTTTQNWLRQLRATCVRWERRLPNAKGLFFTAQRRAAEGRQVCAYCSRLDPRRRAAWPVTCGSQPCGGGAGGGLRGTERWRLARTDAHRWCGSALTSAARYTGKLWWGCTGALDKRFGRIYSAYPASSGIAKSSIWCNLTFLLLKVGAISRMHGITLAPDPPPPSAPWLFRPIWHKCGHFHAIFAYNFHTGPTYSSLLHRILHNNHQSYNIIANRKVSHKTCMGYCPIANAQTVNFPIGTISMGQEFYRICMGYCTIGNTPIENIL